MNDHRHMDHDRRQEQPREPDDDRQVNPADDPGPRGNQEIDKGRLERDVEDLERTSGH
jgi:hypothetical protein